MLSAGETEDWGPARGASVRRDPVSGSVRLASTRCEHPLARIKARDARPVDVDQT